MTDVHVVIPTFAPPAWRWIEPANRHRGWRWHFHDARADGCRAAVEASEASSNPVSAASAGETDPATTSILVTHGNLDARECAKLRSQRDQANARFIAFSFHAPYAFGFRERHAYRKLAQNIDAFVSHCTFECEYYAKQLHVARSRFAMIPWYYEEATVKAPPQIAGNYICAVGASMRDYRTLFEAMHRLPQQRLIAVVRPENLDHRDVPANVTILEQIPKQDLWNIQAHSQLHVLPLHRDSRSGHACLTQAMYFGVPSVVAAVPCVDEYIRPGQTAVTYTPGDAGDLAGAIRRALDDDSLRSRIAKAGKAYALDHFSQRAMGDHVARLVDNAAAVATH